MTSLVDARLIVVKVGSALVAEAQSGAVDHAWLGAFAADAERLRARGQKLVLVSSGAVAIGARNWCWSAPAPWPSAVRAWPSRRAP